MSLESYESKEQFSFSVRQARPEDAEEYKRVFYETWPSAKANSEAGITKELVKDELLGNDYFSEENIERTREVLAKQISSRKILAENQEGDVIGVGSVFVTKEKSVIQTLYVKPEVQGRGVGRELFETLIGFCPNDRPISLWVIDYNNKAIDFYKRNNFSFSGEERKREKYKLSNGTQLVEIEMIRDQE